MSARDDWQRDNWIENNCPKTQEFSRDIVKHFMKMAYDEGRQRETRQRKVDERERIYGPDFI